MRAVVHRGLLWAVTFAAVILGGLFAFALLPGCGASAWQTAVNATATAAVQVDREGAAESYTRAGREAIIRVQANHGTMDEWCAIMRPVWERTQRIECVAMTLVDLSLTGAAILEADKTPGPEWAAAACGTLSAAAEVWGQVESPPVWLTSARAAVCGLAGGLATPEPSCHITPDPPGCEEEGE